MSAIADTSGMTRPGQDALAATAGMSCHEGRGSRFEHQLPPAAQVVAVLRVVVVPVEKSDVPPTAATYELSAG